MIRWTTKDPIGSQGRLVRLLELLEEKALEEGLRYEVASLKVRQRARRRAAAEEE